MSLKFLYTFSIHTISYALKRADVSVLKHLPFYSFKNFQP